MVEVELGGSDTANGGTFDPGRTFTANLQCTLGTGNSPVVTSATYNFVAGDVGAWLFIKSGTSWLPGYYQIASVASNAATLSAAIGQALVYGSGLTTGFNTVAGCSSIATNTNNGTWGVDYSRQSSPQYSLTGLTTAAANAIILTTSATVNMIGNGLVITGGTNFLTGYYTIVSVVAGTSITVDRTCTSAAGATGTAGLGGALASPGIAGNSTFTSNPVIIFINYNASVYSVTTASTSVSGGCFSPTSVPAVVGYNTQRWVGNLDTLRPTIQLNVSTATIFQGNDVYFVSNLILDGNGQTASKGTSHRGISFNVKYTNFTGGATTSNTSDRLVFCEITGSTLVAPSALHASFCEFHGNTEHGISGVAGATFVSCLAYNNTGGAFKGFVANNVTTMVNCSAYGNQSDGFGGSGNNYTTLINCASEGNTGAGYNFTALFSQLFNCEDYSNTGGRNANTPLIDIGTITNPGASQFVNAAAGNFAPLNPGKLIAAAFPALFPAGLTASYGDVGAAQHQSAAGGGGSFSPFPGG